MTTEERSGSCGNPHINKVSRIPRGREIIFYLVAPESGKK
jgi:hypothetical protein